jgi:hypothetical protein
MTKTRKLGTAAAGAIAAGALLSGVAFAGSDMAAMLDAGDNGGASAVAKLAQTTTATGEAKGDAISAAAKAMTTADVDDTTAKAADEDDTDKSASSDRDDHSTSADRDAHGDAVSTLATTTTLTGEAKGDAISALASSKNHRSSH